MDGFSSKARREWPRLVLPLRWHQSQKGFAKTSGDVPTILRWLMSSPENYVKMSCVQDHRRHQQVSTAGMPRNGGLCFCTLCFPRLMHTGLICTRPRSDAERDQYGGHQRAWSINHRELQAPVGGRNITLSFLSCFQMVRLLLETLRPWILQAVSFSKAHSASNNY